jgi:tetratricopeptide (TPR) repeat protein
MAEPFLGGLGRAATALERAQEVIYDAWEADTARERVRLARRALAISKRCADAHVLLAESSAKGIVDMCRHYERGVAAGKAAIGRRRFEEAVGHFWGVFETRPYMRARAGLGECLWDLGEREAAIDHYRDMLRLNPNDNQGLRWPLADWLLAVEDHEAVEKLLADYEDDAFADGAYTRTLLSFRQGDEEGAREALRKAWKANPHVPDLLLVITFLPAEPADTYVFGSPEEAEIYVARAAENWRATRGAIEWLDKAVRPMRRRVRKRPLKERS